MIRLIIFILFFYSGSSFAEFYCKIGNGPTYPSAQSACSSTGFSELNTNVYGWYYCGTSSGGAGYGYWPHKIDCFGWGSESDNFGCPSGQTAAYATTALSGVTIRTGCIAPVEPTAPTEQEARCSAAAGGSVENYTVAVTPDADGGVTPPANAVVNGCTATFGAGTSGIIACGPNDSVSTGWSCTGTVTIVGTVAPSSGSGGTGSTGGTDGSSGGGTSGGNPEEYNCTESGNCNTSENSPYTCQSVNGVYTCSANPNYVPNSGGSNGGTTGTTGGTDGGSTGGTTGGSGGTGSGDTSGGTTGGTTGGTGSGTGSGSGSGTGTGTGEGEGEGEDSESAPSINPIVKGQAGNFLDAEQSWQQKIDETKEQIKNKVGQFKTLFQPVFNFSLSGTSSELPCIPSFTVLSQVIGPSCLDMYSEQLSVISSIFLFVCAFIAIYIVFG